jgi:Bacteriophage holin family, superfamily II-like
MSTANTIDTALAATGSKATYTGSGMILSGWLFSSEFAVLMGIIIGVAGFIVNWYYRHKITNAEIKIKLDELQLKQQQSERDKIEHDFRMKSMRHDIGDHEGCLHEEKHCKHLNSIHDEK